jgi:hypothetical protein
MGLLSIAQAAAESFLRASQSCSSGSLLASTLTALAAKVTYVRVLHDVITRPLAWHAAELKERILWLQMSPDACTHHAVQKEQRMPGDGISTLIASKVRAAAPCITAARMAVLRSAAAGSRYVSTACSCEALLLGCI